MSDLIRAAINATPVYSPLAMAFKRAASVKPAVKPHPDFIVIPTAGTYGQGDRRHDGR